MNIANFLDRSSGSFHRPARRTVLKSLSMGFGYLAFAHLAAGNEIATSSKNAPPLGPLSPKPPHFAARAKRVIFLCMNGGPSHVDLFDYKPTLMNKSGSSTSIGSDRGGMKLLGSPFKFARRGQSGIWMSEVMPHLAKCADDLCMIHSMVTDLPNHSQAFVQMHTGNFQFSRPSLGAWTLYGLGSENQNLPGFVSLNPPTDNGGSKNYGSGFLPAACQGTRMGANQIPAFYAALLGKSEEPGPPMKNISNDRYSKEEQREQIDFIRSLDEHKLAKDQYHPEIEGSIESFELAFRMQDEVPQALDLRSEPQRIQDAYGLGSGKPTDRFGRQCLIARRLAEAGVRFIEVTAPTSWDHHFMLRDKMVESCAMTDQPVAALLMDLKQRGMLDDTLVIWGGEFGRTPYGQSGSGRDHNNKGFSLWMAGGGLKRGYTYGATDEIGYEAVSSPMHIHDWHATLLHILGLDHERLTFNYAGRNFRLTDVHGTVVQEILA